MIRTPFSVLGGLLLSLLAVGFCDGHEKSKSSFLRQRAIALAKADALAEDREDSAKHGLCQLTIELVDAKTKAAIPGAVRITNLESDKAVKLSGEIHRALNWYSLEEGATVKAPRTKIRIEALRGLETELATHEVDLTSTEKKSVKIPLKRFADPAASGLRSGNTHLHLMKLTHAEAIRYLELVPRGDDLDLVFLSHLRRIPDERHYISNEIVENSFAGGSLKRLTKNGVVFSNGEEHRHNFGRGGEGYGHVMLLDLIRLIRPVSIGPGIMRSGTDGIPLQRGISEARGDGATVIWCHNKFGMEDIPNWIKGLLHAQNINDGGPHGSYKDTYYRYLNLGLKVPFSTGTDWFIYDFSRVYVPVKGELTSKKWLEGLRDGRSMITNGPLIELTADDRPVGDTIKLEGPRVIEIVAQGIGRRDFRGLELVFNGDVIHFEESKKKDGHYVCETSLRLKADEPGWIALRIPLNAGKSELDKPLFAHTSPIYIELAGKRIFRGDVADMLLTEMEESLDVIEKKATFANKNERDAVLDVYLDGIRILKSRIVEAAK